MNSESYIDRLEEDVFPFISCEGYEDRYPTQEPLRLTHAEVKELRLAGRALYGVMQKTLRVLKKGDKTLMDSLGIDEKLRPFLAIDNPMGLATFFSRFDFVMTKDGRLKMVELNADTPCAVIEAYYGNEVAADFFGEENPNKISRESLQAFLLQLYRSFRMMAVDLADGRVSYARPFVFSCFDDYVEDRGTTLFLMNQLKAAIAEAYPMVDENQAVCFCSFYDLQVDEEGILLPDGRHAGALYRMHPMELLAEEVAEDGSNLGVYFLEQYKKEKFYMMNPPESIVLQSKTLQALIWALHEDGEFFTEEEHAAIEKYMLPSYFDERDFLMNAPTGVDYVKKPVWGREGSKISVVRSEDSPLRREKLLRVLYEGEEIEEEPILDGETYLYQEYVNTKETTLRTDSGYKNGYLTLSCFMHGKNPSAVYARFSEYEIAGIEAYWAPILYRD